MTVRESKCGCSWTERSCDGKYEKFMQMCMYELSAWQPLSIHAFCKLPLRSRGHFCSKSTVQMLTFVLVSWAHAILKISADHSSLIPYDLVPFQKVAHCSTSFSNNIISFSQLQMITGNTYKRVNKATEKIIGSL